VFCQGVSIRLLREAVLDGSDLVGVAHEVGASAAQMGVPLHEVLDHVERAFAPDPPDFAATRAASVAWAEEAMTRHADLSCEDPLTSLATVPHLRSRLAETYRGAERSGQPVGRVSALVVVELPRRAGGHDLEHSLRALEVCEVLRTVFTGDETIARLSTRRFAALVDPAMADDVTLSLIGLLLDRSLTERGRARWWVQRLPSSADRLGPVLAALCE
jgi:hypothetical protein